METLKGNSVASGLCRLLKTLKLEIMMEDFDVVITTFFLLSYFLYPVLLQPFFFFAFMCPFCTGYERDHAFWCRQLCFTCIFTTTCRYYANVCIKPFGNKTFCSSLIHCIVSTTTCQNVLKGE